MTLRDLEKYEVITQELILGDQVNPDKSAVRVKVVRDVKTGKAYQIDLKNQRYREAPHVLSNYGDWKQLAG